MQQEETPLLFIEEVPDLPTADLKMHLHFLHTQRGKDRSHSIPPLIESIQDELAERQQQQLIGFFLGGTGSQLRDSFMDNPFIQKLRNFNDQLLSIVQREARTQNTTQGFGVRKIRLYSDKQKEAISKLMEKTLSKTKMVEARVLHSSQKQLRPERVKSPLQRLPEIKEVREKRNQPAVYKKISASTHHITKKGIAQQPRRPQPKTITARSLQSKKSARPITVQLKSDNKRKETIIPQHKDITPKSSLSQQLQIRHQSTPFQSSVQQSSVIQSKVLQQSTHQQSKLYSETTPVHNNRNIEYQPQPIKLFKQYQPQQRIIQQRTDDQHITKHRLQQIYPPDKVNKGEDISASQGQSLIRQQQAFQNQARTISISKQESTDNEFLSVLQSEAGQEEQSRSEKFKPFSGSIGGTSYQYQGPSTTRQKEKSINNVFQIAVLGSLKLPTQQPSPFGKKDCSGYPQQRKAQPERQQQKIQEKKIKKNKPRPLTRAQLMMKKVADCLPATLTDYSTSIDSFEQLFTGHRKEGFSLLQAMRHTRDVFTIHMRMVDHEYVVGACNRLAQISKTSVEQYYSENPENVFVHAQNTRIDLRRFVERQKVLASRMYGETEFPEELMFFRAVRAKQQVYDIVGRTFMRRQEWAQLPHGLSLKTSWNLLWTWSRPEVDFNKLMVFQKVNHFPNNRHLVRKDMLKKRIEGAKCLGAKAKQEFDIIPQTFVLPKQYSQFVDAFLQRDGSGVQNYWIMKPVGKSRGRGIVLVKQLGQVLYNQPVVIQQYLPNPMLIDGKKFDMRVYVLVTSMQPLQAFIYSEGFARLSTQEYTTDSSSLNNHMVHLTNYAIQKAKADPNSFGGPKLSFKMLEKKLRDSRVPWDLIWNQVRDIVVKSLVACSEEIGGCPNSFQLFGYDILIDSTMRCWLIEVNASPSLQRDFILDDLIKQQLLDDIIELVDPPYFDRQRLLQVLERRIHEEEGRKSTINTGNKSTAQLNRDLNYLLNSAPLRRAPIKPSFLGGFEQVAPTDRSQRVKRLIKKYKVN